MFVDHQPAIDQKQLSPAHADTVRATLPVIGAHINEITPIFYNRMFKAHPELISDTFNRGNQKLGEQQKALAASIAVFASMLVDPDSADPVEMLGRIGHKHVSLGITEDQYQIVHDHLFAAIIEVLGEAITPEVAEAWEEVYWIMAAVLVEFESELYVSDGVVPGDVFRKVKVTGKENLSDKVTVYTFTGQLTVPKPGQFTSLGVKLPDGARQLRQYSLLDGSSTAYQVAIERTGEVSTFLYDHIKVGDIIEATLAAGDLVLSEGNNPVVFVSGGIGSTPMVGMLAYLVATHSQREVVVLHGDKSAESDAQKNQTAALVQRLNDVVYRTFYESDGEYISFGEDIPGGADIYLCGSTGFLQYARDQIAALPDTQAPAGVHYELFSPNDWLVS